MNATPCHCIECDVEHCDPTTSCPSSCCNQHGEGLTCGAIAALGAFDECDHCSSEAASRAYRYAAAMLEAA
jgi:hypothetical protein